MGESNDKKPCVLEASEFVLKDESGRVGGRLHMTPIGSQLILCGESGKPQINLSVLGDIPNISLTDGSGSVRGSLGLGDRGPHLVLQDVSGTPRAILCLDDNEPLLYLYDKNGKPRGLFGVMFDEGILHLSDSDGKKKVTLGGTRPAPLLRFAALACGIVALLLLPTFVREGLESPVGGPTLVLAVAGAVLAILWTRRRSHWWRTKGRAMAAYLANSSNTR